MGDLVFIVLYVFLKVGKKVAKFIPPALIVPYCM